LNQDLKISVDFARQIIRSERDSTIFLSYLKILEATKNKGGNLPHIKAIAHIIGRSESTARRHIQLLLQKNWIRVNPEKESAYTIVSADRLLNARPLLRLNPAAPNTFPDAAAKLANIGMV